MKKFSAVLLALCLTALTLVPAFAAEEADAVINGAWEILVAADDTPQANYAAKKIQSVLGEGNEYDDFRDCISVKFATPDEWNMYEPGEIGAETRNFFGTILEWLIPFLTGFGLLYKVYKTFCGFNLG